MGKKHPYSTSLDSRTAVADYLKHNASEGSEKNVVVEQNGNVLKEGPFVVIASDNNNYMHVDIIWENGGFEDFRNHELFGRYCTDYYQISYNGGQLVILADNGIKITIT